MLTRTHLFSTLAVLLPLLLLGGCAGDGQDAGAGAYRDEFQQVFGGDGGGASADARAPWAIAMTVHSGRDAMSRAEQTAALLRERFGLERVRARPREDGAVVVFGGYESYDDPQAKKGLERIRSLTVDGDRPFRRAFLAPQTETPVGSHPEMSLSEAKAKYGEGAKYTLQIGVYEADDRQEAIETAERAALQLRQEGELAFYYHGPTRSMVTVGLFGDRDYDPGAGRRSDELEALMERYPYNLLNGRAIKEIRPGSERRQPSALVRVP